MYVNLEFASKQSVLNDQEMDLFVVSILYIQIQLTSRFGTGRSYIFLTCVSFHRNLNYCES